MKFDGTNHQLWERKVHTALARAGLLYYALDLRPLPDRTHNVKVTQDLKAVAIIEKQLSDKILIELPSYASRLAGALNYDNYKTLSSTLLDDITDKYKGPSRAKAAKHLASGTQAGQPLEAYFNRMWFSWKEAGGEAVMTKGRFREAVRKGMDSNTMLQAVGFWSDKEDDAGGVAPAEVHALVEEF
ncbi:hypothetical protein BCV69DRAFT_125641 [Microstroma glucosiphilum]|uniref:Uncharacterized protein n=1 Tax=Pseudomicrostroma glucosiphilum TaxID=1684307 RepID=A0A316TWP7_9BASI|nr:hypothetical protein BCV69DRAFT_125641 [Pseudomicrostroma glucosiphilum]PWN17869.1 hypothetical protein BCV69DRAFT_125641 [Pseudomicrostroma glucosiphilum]